MDTQITKIVFAVFMGLPMALAQEAVKETAASGKSIEVIEQSSKNLIGETKDKWIESMRSKLVIANRVVGPFGMSQDPNSEVRKPQVMQKPQAGAFLSAVAAIKVNTVMVSQRKFTIGSREFSEGDVFPLIRNQRQFNVKIIKVSSGSIMFKDIDTGKYVKRNLEALPAGMSRNAPLDAVPGVTPENKKDETPLNLDDQPIPLSDD